MAITTTATLRERYVCHGCDEAFGVYRPEYSWPYCDECHARLETLFQTINATPPRWPYFLSWGCVAAACALALAVWFQ